MLTNFNYSCEYIRCCKTCAIAVFRHSLCSLVFPKCKDRDLQQLSKRGISCIMKNGDTNSVIQKLVSIWSAF